MQPPALRRQLYLPNPANEKIQICVDGCPGGSTGTCSGNLTRNYLIVDGKEINAGSGSATLGALGALAGLQMPGPDKYERENTCVEKGDCSNAKADMLEETCVKHGRCLNGTVGVNASALDPSPNDDWESRHCLYDQITLEETGYTFEPFEWTAYSWKHNEDDGLFICKPKEMANPDDAWGADDAYPPADFVTANLKGWIDIDNGPCWLPVFPARDVLFRCVPTMLEDMVNPDKLGETAQGQQAVQYMVDIKEYWRVIPFGAIVAVVVAFGWIIFLSKFAGFLIWTSVYGIEILLPCISAACWWQLGVIETRSCKATLLDEAGAALDATLGVLCGAADIAMSPEIYDYEGEALANCANASCALGGACNPGDGEDCTYTSGIFVEIPPEMVEKMAEANDSEAYTYNVAVGSLVAWAVLGIIFIVFSGRIHIAIGVIEEASDAFLDIPTVVFFPVAVLIVSIPISAFCCFACFLLMSLRSVDPATGAMTYCLDENVAEKAFPGHGDPDCLILRGMIASQIFGWLWTVQVRRQRLGQWSLVCLSRLDSTLNRSGSRASSTRPSPALSRGGTSRPPWTATTTAARPRTSRTSSCRTASSGRCGTTSARWRWARSSRPSSSRSSTSRSTPSRRSRRSRRRTRCGYNAAGRPVAQG